MDYEDIINTKYPYETNHKKMDMLSRAAQFGAFAALTGYEEAISEENRFVDKKIELSEDEKNNLDIKLDDLRKDILNEPFIEVTYFVADSKKDGGIYQTYCGNLVKIDNYKHVLIFKDKSKISINDIFKIKYLVKN